RFRLAAPAGQETTRLRCHRARPADIFAVEGTRRFPSGEGLRGTHRRSAAGAQAEWSLVRLGQCRRAEAGGISRRHRSCPGQVAPLDPPTALRSAAARFPDVTGRTGPFEDLLAARALRG